MDRRVFIGALGAGLATAVAGCSETSDATDGGGDGSNDGGGGGSDGSGSDGGGSGDGEGQGDGSASDADDAAERIRSAVGMLNRVGYRLSELQSELESEPTGVELDTEETLAAVDSARGDLDAAEEAATGDQVATVDTLRSLATVLEATTRLVDLLAGVDVDGRLDAVQSEVEAENYDGALSQVRDAKTTAREADEYATTAESAAAELDPARLEAADAVSIEELEPSLVAARRLVDGLLATTEGYESLLLGREDLATARTALDDREFDVAEAALADAEDRFGAADDSFASVEGEEPESLAPRLDRSRCQSGHLVTATEHLQRALEATRNDGRSTAEEYRDRAETELERVDDC